MIVEGQFVFQEHAPSLITVWVPALTANSKRLFTAQPDEALEDIYGLVPVVIVSAIAKAILRRTNTISVDFLYGTILLADLPHGFAEVASFPDTGK